MDPLCELLRVCDPVTRTDMCRRIADQLPDTRVPENLNQLIRDLVDAARACGKDISTIHTSHLQYPINRLRENDREMWRMLFEAAADVEDEVIDQLFKLSPFADSGLLLLRLHEGRLVVEAIISRTFTAEDMTELPRVVQVGQSRFALPVRGTTAVALRLWQAMDRQPA